MLLKLECSSCGYIDFIEYDELQLGEEIHCDNCREVLFELSPELFGVTDVDADEHICTR